MTRPGSESREALHARIEAAIQEWVRLERSLREYSVLRASDADAIQDVARHIADAVVDSLASGVSSETEAELRKERSPR